MNNSQLPEGYKLTEVGVIPEDWDAVLLDKIAKRGSGHTPNKKHSEYWNGDIKWISLADSSALDRLYIDDTFAKITPEGIENSSAIIHPAGTVVLSRDAGIGKSAIMRFEMAVSQHFMAWCCGSELSNYFLYYWLQSAKPMFEQIADGTTIKTIGLAYFKDLRIPLPPLPEQRSIATALSDMDELLGGLDRLIAKKRNLKQAAMQQLLTGKVRLLEFGKKKGYKQTELGVIPEDWKVLQFEQLAHIERGKFTARPRNDPQYYGGNIPFIQTGDVTNSNGQITTYSQTLNARGLKVSKLFPCGTLFFTIAANIGDVGVTAFDAACPDSLVAIIPYQGVDKIWLAYELAKRKASFESIATHNTQLNINLEKLRPYLLPLPPLPEQTAIATILSDMDSEIAALEQRRDKTRALKQAMMQELLTGRIRFV